MIICVNRRNLWFNTPHIGEYIYIHQDADNSNRRSEWSIQISNKGAILH